MNEEKILKSVEVNRKRTFRQAIKSLGFRRYVNKEVVDTMPKGRGKKVIE